MNASTCESSVAPHRREESLSKIEQVTSSGQLPSPKGVALAIMEICRRGDASLEAIAKVVQTDPALSGRLLRLANSASAAGGRPVIAIREAVMRLGLSNVRQLAMGFSLVDQHKNGPCRGFDYSRFWSHSLLMAVSMQALGRAGGVGQADELFA